MDTYFALFGVFISIVLIIGFSFIKRPIFLIPVSLILIFSIVWLRFKDKLYVKDISDLNFQANKRNFLVTSILFFVFLSFTVLTLYLTPYSTYSRPFSYFILLSLMAGICLIGILFAPSQKYYKFLVFLEIFIIGTISVVSQIQLFSSLIGIDPFWYQSFTNYMMSNGHIAENTLYSKLPIFSGDVASFSLLTSLDYKYSALFSVSLIEILISILFIFLMGKKVFNEKIGLIAALIFSVCNYQIYIAVWTIPTTIAFPFVITILYLVLNNIRKETIKNTFLILFLMLLLIMTHTITAFLMAVILFTFWIAQSFYNRFIYDSKKNYVTLSIATLFSVGMFSWWIYASNAITSISALIKWGFSMDFFIKASSSAIAFTNSIPLQEQILSNLGFFLFFSFAFVGFLYMISRNKNHKMTFSVAFVIMFPLVLSFFSFISQHSLVQDRWWYYSEVLLSIPLAISFLFLTNFKNRKLRLVSLTVLTVFLTFIMIISPIANSDRNPFFPHIGTSYGYTDSEMSAASFFSQHTKLISTDDSYEMAFPNFNNLSFVDMDNSLTTKNFAADGSIKIIRQYIVKNTFSLNSLNYKLEYNPNSVLSTNFNQIYDNGLVTAYK